MQYSKVPQLKLNGVSLQALCEDRQRQTEAHCGKHPNSKACLDSADQQNIYCVLAESQQKKRAVKAETFSPLY